MKKQNIRCRGLVLAAAALCTVLQPAVLRAAGLLIADGGLGGVLEVKEHDVQVTINNGIAVTKVTEVFRNTENRQVEALYTFPVPRGASVASFSMWINGKEMVGEVLEKKRAREIYDSYKQARRDPGLLEQVDYKTFELRIFPIAPSAEQKVQISYYQELDFDHDWATYVYPLATATRKDLDTRATGRFAFALDVKSAVPITALDSPSHGEAFVVAKHSDSYYQASLESRGGTVLNPALTTAYKYADADRPLNVVLLSDGLTEQQERRTLLELIRTRPRNAKVFCIGVGNDVNRPLLEQLAQDAGGLSAFLSHGDSFTRQAQAFRRKLTRPVATDLQIDFGAIKVSDLEPKILPNLYHGAPVRIYGRYQGSGEAQVAVRGSVNGVELKQAARLEFPKQDLANPEIDRMWAWRRIDGLLKQADRTGSRNDVAGEIVRLGEGYSIATEYTSFLVLENDAEFQRWKIARNNLLRTDRDRKAQQLARAQLDGIRNKAVANLGPAAEPPQVASAQSSAQTGVTPPAATPQAAPAQPAAPANPAPARPRNGFDFGHGSGPVGPLFLGLVFWLRRQQRIAA